jgi:hypothetical protein
MATPKPKPKPKLSESQKREEILKQNQKRISPEGVAAADAAAKKALEEKYPGMFIPGTRTTAGVYRAR